MSIVESGFVSSSSGSEQIAYGADISGSWGFIGWSGQITDVYCEEYRNGSYYDEYTLISSKSCVDSRAEWGLYPSTFAFNYGAAYTTTKLIMNITTTLGNAVFTYDYIMVGNCTPPSNPQLSVSETTGSATLSWTAGGAGTNNPVTGYVITYQDSSNGSTWGEVNYLKEVTGTSTTVDAPDTTGYYRRFGIQTKGSAGDDYLSSVVWSSGLKKISITACGAPTSFSCSPTLTDSTTTLSWSGASAGTGNAIQSYEIQYCESSDGVTWGSWAALITVTSTATSGTKGVSASATYGNYRKFRIRTRGSAGSSYYSGWKESTNTVRRKWAPFGAWTDPTLVARSSMIRAVYLTEIQTRVNSIRAFYGLGAYSFTAVTARVAKVARWADLIGEIRTAIDGITTNHEAWNTLEAGKPRIAHITQLRSIIDNL